MPNFIDSPKHREMLGTKNTDQIVKAVAHATYNTLLSETMGEHSIAAVIYNCEYSTVSTVIIWLQERGCIIPADILATLGIEAK